MRICKTCKIEKELKEFHKNGKWYRRDCRKCFNAKYRPPTGKPNTGRYKKGNVPINPFKKGNIPWNKGKKLPERLRLILLNAVTGRKHSPEEIEKRRQSLIKSWDKKRIKYGRQAYIHVRWSRDVRKRDNYICQECNITDVPMHAHHIKSWKDYPALRFEISNGITLCVPCHLKKHDEDKRNKIPWNKGRKLSMEHRRKLSEARKGKIPWNKGLRNA